MSPTLLNVLRQHEYWRLAWVVKPIGGGWPNDYLRGGKSGTAIQMLRRHKHDTRRCLRTGNMVDKKG